jgi:hypothetical protein
VLHLLTWHGVRPPDTVNGGAPDMVLTWTPDLTVADADTARRIIRITGALRMTPDEMATIEPDVAIGKQFIQEPTPTQQQTVTALKSAWRVLAAILKD